MKILAILGSPRGKGSGSSIVRELEAGMQIHGEVEFEYLFLKDQHLELCKGCFACVTRGEERCPLKDDREKIEAKIDAADGLVLVSPCYVSNVSWLMKNFIDRMCYTNHRPRFFHQKVAIIANAGSGMEKTIENMRLALGKGPEIVGDLSYLTPPWPLSPSVEQKQAEAVRKLAGKLYSSIQRDAARNGLPLKPSFSDYLHFRFFKRISADVQHFLKADWEYYKQLGSYYYPVKISLFKRTVTGLILRLGMLMMKDLSPYTRN